MNQMIVDQELETRLGGLAEALELCDASGRVLAYVTPAWDRSIYDVLQSPDSPEKLDRRLREDERFTTAEVLRHLVGSER